eukprot:33276-Amphidinium_carterae.1
MVETWRPRVEEKLGITMEFRERSRSLQKNFDSQPDSLLHFCRCGEILRRGWRYTAATVRTKWLSPKKMTI